MLSVSQEPVTPNFNPQFLAFQFMCWLSQSIFCLNLILGLHYCAHYHLLHFRKKGKETLLSSELTVHIQDGDGSPKNRPRVVPLSAVKSVWHELQRALGQTETQCLSFFLWLFLTFFFYSQRFVNPPLSLMAGFSATVSNICSGNHVKPCTSLLALQFMCLIRLGLSSPLGLCLLWKRIKKSSIPALLSISPF